MFQSRRDFSQVRHELNPSEKDLTVPSSVFWQTKSIKPSGTPIEENVFTAMDTISSRIEEDILRNNKHIEIVISKKGVNTNQ